MTAALSRRLRALELKAGKTSRPTTAFVIRASSAEEAKALLNRAIGSNEVRSGDPVLIITCLGFEQAQWQDVADLTLDDLAAMAEGGTPSKEAAGFSVDELRAAIIDGLPRVA
jgi:hypothetical protein